MSEENTRRQIDNMNYETMLRHVRFDPIGSKFFINDMGDYFGKVMADKAKQLSEQEKIEISKRVGR